MTTITIRIDTPGAEERLAKLHGNKTNGATRAVEAYLAIRNLTMPRLVGRFTQNELKYLVDIQNGTIFQAGIAASARTWIAEVEDSDTFDYMGKKWGVNVPTLIEKIKQMASAEIFFMREEIDRFWNADGKQEMKDLDNLVSTYCD